jgi:hypothetical protein
MNQARSVTATFTIQQFTLTVTKAGSGSGTVTSNPSGINCGTTCDAPFNSNTVVTLTATAATGSVFSGWSGSGCSGTGTCQVTMNQARSVTATFNVAYETGWLEITFSGTGWFKSTNVPEYANVNYIMQRAIGSYVVRDPSYSDCPGNVLDIGTTALGESAWFYPTDADYYPDGIVIPGTVRSITVEVQAVSEHYDPDGRSGAAASTNATAWDLGLYWLVLWNHTYCGTGSGTLPGPDSGALNALLYGEPLQVRVGNRDTYTLNDYNVGIKRVRYTFNGWMVPAGTTYSGPVQIEQIRP